MIKLVHNAVQRALLATTASSPRTIMMTTAPTSGSQVSSDSSGKPMTQRTSRKRLTSTTRPISMVKA